MNKDDFRDSDTDFDLCGDRISQVSGGMRENRSQVLTPFCGRQSERLISAFALSIHIKTLLKAPFSLIPYTMC